MSTNYPPRLQNARPLISVIIPIYNGADFISSCLDSIINQNTDFDIEIICVNDGSTDNTSQICNEYSQKYFFVKLVEQTNGGVTAARRTGVKECTGQWICFVDADDTLPQNSLKFLSGGCCEKYDIIIGEMLSETKTREMQNREFRKRIICSKVSTSPCAKLYRRDIFQPAILDIPRQIVYGEDMIMNIRLAFQTEKPVLFIGKVVYSYVKNANSTSHSFKKTADYEEMFAETLRFSIPERFRQDSDYNFARITCKINGWRGMNFMRMSTDENRKTAFYRHLVTEIKESKYPLSWQNRIHVFGKSKPLRAIAIALNLMPIVKYKILYKLKQIYGAFLPEK